MTLVEILKVNEGQTHPSHPPGRLVDPDPERRFFTSIEYRARIDVGPLKGFVVHKRSTYYGDHPSVALRRAYVRLSECLAE